MAIGITTLDDPRTTTDYIESGLGVGASLWDAVTLFLACFLGGMVSTRVTDRPDRGGAVIHGTVVWTLISVFLIWLLGQGISFGLSSLFGALGGLTRTAATTVQESATVGSWITFGVLAATFIIAILGALTGIPSLDAWRSRWAHTGAA